MFALLKRFRTLMMVGVYLVVASALVLGARGDSQLGIVGTSVLQGSNGAEDLVQHGLGGVGEAWDDYLDLVGVRRENARLRDELDLLRDEHTRLLGVLQENARLRAMVGFGEAHPRLDLVPARVVAKDVSPFFRVISVRLHARDSRIRVGMPVVASAGVVGHVDQVAGDYADVVLAVDPRSSIDVLVQHNRARGVLQGLGHDDDYRAKVAYLLRRDEVSAGDVVVTSGMGGRFPPDLVVGRIVDVERQSYGLFQEVEVEPSVDFSRLEEVYIIVGSE
jgi:rod shape-determining protein MreC